MVRCLTATFIVKYTGKLIYVVIPDTFGHGVTYIQK